jgi:two-component system response regulator YesN
MDIKEYIDKNFFFDLSLSSLADIFHIESTYLSRAFKQETGENITNYISKIRMEKAVELIKNQKIKISEAAALVGYEDYAYFNRIFKKYTGKSPREFFLDISK